MDTPTPPQGTGTPPPTPPTPADRITKNIAAMRSQGATEHDIETYLTQHEGLKPSGAPESNSAPTGNFGDAVNSGLDVLGLGKQLRGGVAFAKDLIQNRDLGHAENAYTGQLASDKARLTSYSDANPKSAMVGQGLGVLGTLFGGEGAQAANAASKLPEAGSALMSAATGVVPTVQRIGQAAKTGAVVGGSVAGANADGSLGHRLYDAATGALAGGVLGGGARAIGEVAGAGVDAYRQLRTPAAVAGVDAANARIAGKLSASGMVPDDLLTAAMKAKQTGTPAVVAHLAGPGMDNLSWLASTGPSSDAAALRTSVTNAQRAEGGVLNRGVTQASGVPDNPAYSTPVVKARLEGSRAAAASVNYPKAYAAPDVTDPRILSIIKNDPDLSASLLEGINVMRQEQSVAGIRGQVPQDIPNPLEAAAKAGPQLTPEGETLKRLYPNTDIDALIRKGFGADNSEAPTSIPIQMLDYMKRGADVVAQRGLKKGNLSEHSAGLLNQKIDAILQLTDRAAPEYGAARQGYAVPSQQLEALDAGTPAMNKGGSAIALDRANLPNDATRSAYNTAATSSLRDQINTRRTSGNISGTFDNPFAENQLTALYGGEGRAKMQPYLDQGNRVNQVNEAVTGNSKTADRLATSTEQLGRQTLDAAGALTSPRRFVMNLPGKLADARDLKVKQAMLQELARSLNVSATSPELPDLVERLYHVTKPPLRDMTNTSVRAEVAGILSGLGAANQ